MESSAEQTLKTIELIYENIYNLLDGFQKATISNNESIIVPQTQPDGSVVNVTINSFQKILHELTRIDTNYQSLLNTDSVSYTLEADGSVTQNTKTSFMNAEFLSNFNFDVTQCVVDKTSNIDDLVFPSVKLPITLSNILRTDVRCKILEITDGWELIPDNSTLLNIDYLYTNGKINYIETNRTLPLQKQQVQSFGKFTVENSTVISTNVYQIILDSVQYTAINVIGNSIDLKIGDILVSKTGASKYIINTIDKLLKTLTVTKTAGIESLQVGIDALYFNETLTTDTNIVQIPIRPSKKLLVFLSTENIKNVSYPSNAIKIDTTNFKVTYQNITYTLDEFFSKYVTNLSEYLSSLLNETTIPVTLGIIPLKPVLNAVNFKVLQANKHLTDAKTIADLTQLNKNKQVILNDIEFKQSQINQYQNDIDTNKFNSIEEKNYRLNQIQTLKQQILTEQQNVLVIAKNLDANAVTYGLKDTNPKYQVIAFWPIQTPIYSPLTTPQNIIKYDVQYRYLSADIDTLESTSYKMIDNSGNVVTVAFSNWIDLPTKCLTKVQNADGTLSWEIPLLDSVDDININQLSISIQENESVEIKVRAVSEAGYPIAPLKSEWSDILRVDFPSDLTDNSINSIVSQNDNDLTNAMLNDILQNAGLLSHVAGTIKEADKTYLHNAKDIASGQYTTEQKNISLDIILTNMLQDINVLKSTDISNNIIVNLIDFNGEAYTVINNTTMELLAGNYSDDINLLDSTKYGSILRKKAYIKIRNNNLVPVELKTLVPGTDFNNLTASQYYNVPVKNPNNLVQNSKQIIYFRNIDLNGNNIDDVFKLVKPKLANSNTYPKSADIDTNALDAEKTIVYYDSIAEQVKICKLLEGYDTNFVAFTTNHPLYDYNNMSNLLSEFNRIKLFTANIKALQYQSEVDANDTLGLGFSDYDFYGVGQNTCGAFLYPLISNIASISVVGNTTVSTLIIPNQSEILIPIVFEYRMVDRLGNIDGTLNFDINNTPLIYSKKIGVDILLNNSLFKFDVNVTINLKAKLTPISSLNIGSITSAFTNQLPETLL